MPPVLISTSPATESQTVSNEQVHAASRAHLRTRPTMRGMQVSKDAGVLPMITRRVLEPPQPGAIKLHQRDAFARFHTGIRLLAKI